MQIYRNPMQKRAVLSPLFNSTTITVADTY